VRQWSITDLIDLEFLSAYDGAPAELQLEKRDREIFLQHVQPNIKNAPAGSKSFRRQAIRIWLEQRRRLYRSEQGGEAVLPGDAFAEARGLAGLVIAIIGIISGAGLALSLLVYDGQQPINVSVYFGVLVLLQILFILLTLRFFFMRSSLKSLNKFSILYPLMGRVLDRMMKKLIQGAAGKLSARRTQNLEAVYGMALAKHTIYSRVIFWSFFSLMQLFGVMFSLGAITATLIRVFTADLAFGWQSTIQLSSQAVHNMVRILSAPWAWIIPHGVAYPSLDQIEGSRMVLKEGIYHLTTGNLVSWWPFLICAVCVYGLLPRIILYAIAVFGQKMSVSKLDFSPADYDRLFMRMTRPVLSTAGTASGGRRPSKDNSMGLESIDGAVKARGIPSIVLVSSDIIPLLDKNALSKAVSRSVGWDVLDVKEIQGEAGADRAVLDALSDSFKTGNKGAVLLLEAWQPPIMETVEFIRELRKRLGKKAPISVLLIGKPDGQTIFTPVDRSDKEVWSRALKKLADPYLRFEALGDVR
jgi:hypothetical protein